MNFAIYFTFLYVCWNYFQQQYIIIIRICKNKRRIINEFELELERVISIIESQEFKIDMDKLTNKINEVNEWANEIVKDNNDILVKLEEYIKRYSKLTELISK